MSFVPLEYFMGLGARTILPGRADPEKCQATWDTWDMYEKWKVQAEVLKDGDPIRYADAVAERDKYYKQWQALRAQEPCRAAATSSSTSTAPAPRSSTSPVMTSPTSPVSTGGPVPSSAPSQPSTTYVLPKYEIPQRSAFGFESRLAPISLPGGFVLSPPQQAPRRPALSIGRIPTWAAVAGATVVGLVVIGALLKGR